MRKLLFVSSRLAVAVSLLLPGASLASDTVYISIEASTGIDTLIKEIPGAVVVSLDVGSDTVYSAQFYFEWQLSNGNIMGQLYLPGNPKFSEMAIAVFESRSSNFGNGSEPETTFTRLIDFGSVPLWIGGGEMFRYKFVPLDTGIIIIDPESSGITPELFTVILTSANPDAPFVATSPPITVVTCASIVITGDVNRDADITSSDIIYMVNYIFKGGPAPLPVYVAGDVNCTGDNTSSDIIYLVNFVFKSGIGPCDACP